MAVTNISKCALSCLLQSVAAVGCLAGNTTCICDNLYLAPLTAACLTTNCMMQDSLDVAQLEASICRLEASSHSQEVLVVTAVMWTIASVAVLLRLLSIYHGRSIHKEDILVTVAVVVAIVPVTCLIKMSYLGFGTHLWALQDGALSRILQLFYVAEVFYVAILCLMKISLVFFYLRIFPGRTFRNASYVILGFIIVPALTLTFLTTFSCQPVELFWNKDIKTGTCLDVTTLAYANSGFAVAQDFLILALPLSKLPKLQIKLGRKIGVGLMIVLGSFGWITSIIRLRALSVFGLSIDPTWDYVPVVNWTAVELATGILCGCIPAIRSLLVRYFPTISLLASEQSSSSNTKRQRHDVAKDPIQKSANMGWPLSAHYTEIGRNIFVNPGADYSYSQSFKAGQSDVSGLPFEDHTLSQSSDVVVLDDVCLKPLRRVIPPAGRRSDNIQFPSVSRN